MSKLSAGLLIAIAAMAGIYAIAATIATDMTADFTSAETTRHTRIAEFASGLKRAASEHKIARAKCEVLTATEANHCNAEATAEQQRARSMARVKYKGGIIAPVNAGMNDIKTAREIDVALYRVHRQLPD